MTYPQRKTCPACDAPVLLVAGSRRGGTPTPFDPEPRTGADGYDCKLSDDLSHVAVSGAAHLMGHEALYRAHTRMTCPANLRVPAGKWCPSWAGYSQAAAGPKPPAAAPSWPQPWEGINGTVRDTDDLLSLCETAMPRRRIMVAMALCTYRATLAGNPGPVASQIGRRIRDPQPGDLVAEATGARDPRYGREGFGILLACRREWLQCDEEWLGSDNDGRPSGDVSYVQFGPKAEDVERFAGDVQLIAMLANDA
jgi:hypothetical protein